MPERPALLALLILLSKIYFQFGSNLRRAPDASPDNTPTNFDPSAF